MSNLKLDGTLVKDVSRSFYLTLSLLPPNIREVISLGYLLARASDTIADTHTIALNIRIETLEAYAQDVIKGALGAKLQELITRHFSAQQHSGEQVLMLNLSDVVSSIHKMTIQEQELLQKVVATIIKGQMWDLTYFKDDDTVTMVETQDLLENYTYSVAGCVGEFWTEVLLLHNYIKPAAREQMLALGINYGKGLQLTNILRDFPEDLEKKRVYLPSASIASDHIIKSSSQWIEQAKEYLKQGEEYANRLPYGRLKSATLLPARLGLRTLDLMENSTNEDRLAKVKISRKIVFKELFKTFL